MKHHRKIFMLEWTESMGPEWMNIDNLYTLLSTPKYVRKTIIDAKDVTPAVNAIRKIGAELYMSKLHRARILHVIKDIQESKDPISIQTMADLLGRETEIGQSLVALINIEE